MKKILILANNDVGLYKFRRELIERMLKFSEVIISLPYGEYVDYLIEKGCIFIDTQIDRRGINPFKDLILLRQYIEICKKFKPDIIITYTIKPNIYGAYIAKKMNITYIANITGLGTAFQGAGFLRRVVVYMYKRSLKKAKAVLFENSENMNLFINEKIIKKKQGHLLNGAGVNLKYYNYLEYPKETEKIKFLFVGRVMKEKGINELFQAMQMLYKEGIRTTLDILGEYEEDYTDKIKKYEEEGWLHYNGFKKDVRAYIKNCHCFILPSWHEGMANTNLECAACGRPIITSNISGCREAVLDGKSGYLVNKKDTDNLYKTMKKFIELPNKEKENMGIMGRMIMKNTFDREKVIKETLRIIEGE